MRAIGKFVCAFDRQIEASARLDGCQIDRERWIVCDRLFDPHDTVAIKVNANLTFVHLARRNRRGDFIGGIEEVRSHAIAFGDKRFKFDRKPEFAQARIIADDGCMFCKNARSRRRNRKRDFAHLTRRDDFVKVTGGAPSARGNTFNQHIGCAFVFELEGVTDFSGFFDLTEIMLKGFQRQLRRFVLRDGGNGQPKQKRKNCEAMFHGGGLLVVGIGGDFSVAESHWKLDKVNLTC